MTETSLRLSRIRAASPTTASRPCSPALSRCCLQWATGQLALSLLLSLPLLLLSNWFLGIYTHQKTASGRAKAVRLSLAIAATTGAMLAASPAKVIGCPSCCFPSWCGACSACRACF